MTYSPKVTVDGRLLLGGLAVGLLLLAFGGFLRALFTAWMHDEEFSYGILIPVIVALMLWWRRNQIQEVVKTGWSAAYWLVIAGCGLQVLASVSGSFLLSGMALTVTIMGAAGFLWGRRLLGIILAPLALLILMVPLPSYAVGELAWHLQERASTISATLLGFLGVPVFQDGNLLRLSNYVLEVKQACSGSRSIFALLALACVLGVSSERKWWVRILLVVAAPVLAITANVFRIVGTGLIARYWGDLAANESLHDAWGIAVFLIAVLGLLGLQRLLRWTTHANA